MKSIGTKKPCPTTNQCKVLSVYTNQKENSYDDYEFTTNCSTFP